MTITEDLKERIQKGDERAFEAVFRSLYRELCAYANKYLMDMDQAEEVVQDVFCNFWHKKKELQINGDLQPYLFRSVRNSCFNHLKHLKVRKEYAEDQLAVLKLEESRSEDLLQSLELQKKIEECLLQLPSERQKIFRMSREEGMKYREIAEKLNLSIKTVEAQMGKALQNLREQLSAYLDMLLIVGYGILYWLNNNF